MNVLSESLMAYQEKWDYARVHGRSLACLALFIYLVNHNNALTESPFGVQSSDHSKFYPEDIDLWATTTRYGYGSLPRAQFHITSPVFGTVF